MASRYGESFPVSAEVLDSSFCLPIGKAKVCCANSYLHHHHNQFTVIIRVCCPIGRLNEKENMLPLQLSRRWLVMLSRCVLYFFLDFGVIILFMTSWLSQ